MPTHRLNRRYGLNKSVTGNSAVDEWTGVAPEPEPEPQAQIADAGGGGSRQLALAGGGGGAGGAAVPYAALPKSEKRERTRDEVERYRRRVAAIETRNTMTLEEYISPEQMAVAKENLATLRLNTTGYLARKVQEGKEAAAKEAAEQREREKSPDVFAASSAGDVEQLRFLLAREAQRHAEDCIASGAKGDAARAQRGTFSSKFVRLIDQEGRTPLHYAACFGHREVAETLCSAGADPLAVDPSGYTALHFACRWDKPEVAEYLLSLTHLGVDINCQDQWGQTPLHVAALAGHAEVVQLLLKHNCSLEATDDEVRTPRRLLTFFLAGLCLLTWTAQRNPGQDPDRRLEGQGDGGALQRRAAGPAQRQDPRHEGGGRGRGGRRDRRRGPYTKHFTRSGA